MKKIFVILFVLASFSLAAQDSASSRPVGIFNTQKAILSNTTEMVGKGKMDFRITHNFDDMDGHGASMLSRFLGLDNAKDLRIGFHIGLTDHLDISVARIKGGNVYTNNASGAVGRFYELALKYRFMEQRENDPKHPLSMALFVSNAISSSKASVAPNTNFENSFTDFSDRMNQTVQLIIAKKIGKVSVVLNPTYTHTNFVVKGDDKSMFALGGAIRLPVSRRFALLVDYWHPFRSDESKTFFATQDNTYNPPGDVSVNSTPFKFYDPLGVGVEITTAGHVFSLNFCNSVDILENRFIRFTTRSWTKGQYRWCFTISRKFTLWRDKK